ncbi:MAG: transporter substrate-binding domain-containing protein, partial [Candidatus Omnitrophica bacterium]|nr:transporter substrate-binding domain-containing protein [Candidatus Omnitrophota bacterium]
MKKQRRWLPSTLSILSIFSAAAAFDSVSVWAQESQTLVVATREAPPFAMKREGDRWEGLTIELWSRIAERLALDYEYREMDLEPMLEGVRDGSVDVAAAALTVTADREKEFDFTQPFFNSGLGIAVVPKEGNLMVGVLNRIFSVEFFQAVAALALVLILAGFLVWLFERKKNSEEFGGSTGKGLGSGFWWAAVTMTTVGYGDKSPKTAGGRTVALVWMFASVIVISSFTAMIATALTVGELHSEIQGPEDLYRHRVGTLAGSTSETYAKERDMAPRSYDSIEEALTALSEDRIDAVVHDAPLLEYYAHHEFEGQVDVLPRVFARQNYAFALPEKSERLEPINQVLLEE